MVVKYKLGEVAKDFNKSAKDITDLLLKFFDEPKKNQTALDSKELDIIFDVLTQENQVANFNEYFATQKPVKKAEKKPAEKKAEPKKAEEKKEEYSLAVKKDGKMIGELVLHNFDADGGVEMGFRFFKEFQGGGYATESASVLKQYVFEVVGATKLKSRCYKQNLPSKRLIERLGLNRCREDDTHFYFGLKRDTK